MVRWVLHLTAVGWAEPCSCRENSLGFRCLCPSHAVDTLLVCKKLGVSGWPVGRAVQQRELPWLERQVPARHPEEGRKAVLGLRLRAPPARNRLLEPGSLQRQADRRGTEVVLVAANTLSPGAIGCKAATGCSHPARRE